jgi:DNA-binding NtrC family response regulator
MNPPEETFSLLLVDDEPSVLSSLKRVFFEDDYQIHTAGNGDQALALLSEVKVDAALIDLKMPGMDGLTLLKEMHRDYPQIMVIMLTGHGSIQEAVEAVKLGAVDFLEKPYAPEALRVRIDQLYQIWNLREENRRLRSRIEFQFGFDRLVGNSTAMLKLKELIAQIGPNDAPVLIQGETGTGKELVARAIHHHSARSDGSFVPVDCAAISETVIESELFGHVKGAFTGAHMSTLGLVRSADRGTLFLDEVGELSPAIQSKLLRTIQESEVRPVGSNKAYPVDFRILAATNRDLAKEVAENNFREDLYYRLNVVVVEVPPLRERKEDLALLTNYFLKRFATDLAPAKEVARQTYLCLENYDWPGNIRELENVIRRTMALGRTERIEPEDLPANIFAPAGDGSAPVEAPSGDSMAAYEKSAILNALIKSGYNRRIAAHIIRPDGNGYPGRPGYSFCRNPVFGSGSCLAKDPFPG